MELFLRFIVVMLTFALLVNSEVPAVCQKCLKDNKCKPPSCSCCRDSLNNIPNIKINQIPQMVFFTFDDAVTKQVAGFYRDLFATDRKNPNGCPISMTLFISHENTKYGIVSEFHRKGMEIASHSVTHSTMNGSNFYEEAKQQKENLAKLANIPISEITGWRSPFLKPTGDLQPDVLKKLGYTYDATLTFSKRSLSEKPPGPFTLDFGFPYECQVKPCPKHKHPGFWEVPVVSLLDFKHKYDCVYVDGCMNAPPDENKAYQFLWDNFHNYYTTTRMPFGINMHPSWFYYPDRLKAMDRFIKKLVSLNDVYVVSANKMLEWLKRPTPLQDLHSFAPWSCDGRNNGRNVAKPRLVKTNLPPPPPVQWKPLRVASRQSTNQNDQFTNRRVPSSNRNEKLQNGRVSHVMLNKPPPPEVPKPRILPQAPAPSIIRGNTQRSRNNLRSNVIFTLNTNKFTNKTKSPQSYVPVPVPRKLTLTNIDQQQENIRNEIRSRPTPQKLLRSRPTQQKTMIPFKPVADQKRFTPVFISPSVNEIDNRNTANSKPVKDISEPNAAPAKVPTPTKPLTQNEIMSRHERRLREHRLLEMRETQKERQRLQRLQQSRQSLPQQRQQQQQQQQQQKQKQQSNQEQKQNEAALDSRRQQQQLLEQQRQRQLLLQQRRQQQILENRRQQQLQTMETQRQQDIESRRQEELLLENQQLLVQQRQQRQENPIRPRQSDQNNQRQWRSGQVAPQTQFRTNDQIPQTIERQRPPPAISQETIKLWPAPESFSRPSPSPVRVDLRNSRGGQFMGRPRATNFIDRSRGQIRPRDRRPVNAPNRNVEPTAPRRFSDTSRNAWNSDTSSRFGGSSFNAPRSGRGGSNRRPGIGGSAQRSGNPGSRLYRHEPSMQRSRDIPRDQPPRVFRERVSNERQVPRSRTSMSRTPINNRPSSRNSLPRRSLRPTGAQQRAWSSFIRNMIGPN